MCLDRKAEFKSAKTGFKTMGIDRNGRLNSSLFGNFKLQPMGEWLQEKDYRENPNQKDLKTEDFSELYPIGWHIFHTLRAAREWSNDLWSPRCIVKVKVRYPKATGYQDGMKVTVAREIKILTILEKYDG